MTERKATEVLMEILIKVDDLTAKTNEVLAYQKVIDHNYKILLNRLNTNNQNVSAKVEPSVVFPSVSADEETFTPADAESETVKFNPDGSARKTPVQQKILYSDGTVLALASVSILNTNKELVKQVKTSMAGKWSAALLPGVYEVRINKDKKTNRSEVRFTYNITVNESALTLELEPQKVT